MDTVISYRTNVTWLTSFCKTSWCWPEDRLDGFLRYLRLDRIHFVEVRVDRVDLSEIVQFIAITSNAVTTSVLGISLIVENRNTTGTDESRVFKNRTYLYGEKSDYKKDHEER